MSGTQNTHNVFDCSSSSISTSISSSSNSGGVGAHTPIITLVPRTKTHLKNKDRVKHSNKGDGTTQPAATAATPKLWVSNATLAILLIEG